MFKPGHLIMIGTFATVVGLIPPVGILCVVSGLFCLYFGIKGLDKESKEETQSEDGDKDE